MVFGGGAGPRCWVARALPSHPRACALTRAQGPGDASTGGYRVSFERVREDTL
jgi:hypothetical protein